MGDLKELQAELESYVDMKVGFYLSRFRSDNKEGEKMGNYNHSVVPTVSERIDFIHNFIVKILPFLRVDHKIFPEFIQCEFDKSMMELDKESFNFYYGTSIAYKCSKCERNVLFSLVG